MRKTSPHGKRLLSFVVLMTVVASLTHAAKADDGLVDVRNLPRPEGALENTARTQSYSLTYGVPTAVAVTSEATRKLLAADGWVQYLRPLDEKSRSLTFKKGPQGLHVSFTQRPGRPDQSAVSYTADRITANVPFPPDATDIVFDEHRPYLGCIAPAALDATLDFFRNELAAIGWRPLIAADVGARWPNADLSATIPNGVRTYYAHDDGNGFYRQKPIMLSLQRRDDGRTAVDIRVAPFALQQTLEADSEMAGLPRPKPTRSARSLGDSNSARRTVDLAVIADIPAVLAFYRRALAAQDWTEETQGAVISSDNVVLNFSSTEQTATLKLSRTYDLTTVSLVTQMTETALAARAKAKREADQKFLRDAEATAMQVIAADAARRAAQAANLSDAPLRPLANSSTPVPMPENAEEVTFDGSDGRLQFKSASSVKAIAAFYRTALKAQGWNERPSVINNANMARLEFAKGGKTVSFTAMQMGPKVNVSADGSGLVVAKVASGSNRTDGEAAGKSVVEKLDADPGSELPVPKQRTRTSLASSKFPGGQSPFRRELEASVPADIHSVLAFYRGELTKLGWTETADQAVIKPDQVQLAFASAEGPAVLRLGRKNGETTVNLIQKNPSAAAQADVMPKPGLAKLMFGNIGEREAVVTINKKTVRVAAGAGGPQSPKGPMIDLPPGKYSYATKIAGGPSRSNQIEIAAGDAWGLMVGPDGDVLPLQMY